MTIKQLKKSLEKYPDNMKVYDSRTKGYLIRRRRKCLNCGFRWMTVEIDYWKFIELLRKADAEDDESFKH